MTSTFRTTVDAIVSDLQTNVAGLATDVLEWRVRKSPQFVYPADGPSLACWFEVEEQDNEEGPTGARWYRELYVLRYWEPAVMDEENLIPDDADYETLSVLYEAVRDRIMRTAAQSFGGASPLWAMRGKLHQAGEIPEDGEEAAFTRGFELHVFARRFREFTA